MNDTQNLFQKKTQELLENFHNLTGIKICLFDASGEELYFYPKKLSGFCELIRKNPTMDEACKNCEKKAFLECKKTQSHYAYTCHAGLLECVTPIIYGQNVLGYIMLGQMRKKGDDFKKIKKLLPSIDLDKLEEEFHLLPKISTEKLNSAICVLDACASYEYLKQIVSEKEQKIDIQISNYINANAEGDLSVQKLCSVFHLSNNELYSIFKEYFMSTPAEYIKNRRLNIACDMLIKSDLAVSTICKKVGFFDYNYFSKIFKKQFGISPTKYRKGAK